MHRQELWDRTDDGLTHLHVIGYSGSTCEVIESKTMDGDEYRSEVLRRQNEAPAPKKAGLGSVIKGAANLARGEVESGKPVHKRKVPLEVVEERKRICLSCNKFDFGKCDEMSGCGCYLASKVVLPEQECPDGKWGAVP